MLCCRFGRAAPAQPQAPSAVVRLTGEQSRFFSTSFAALAAQAKVTLVIEGVPLPQTLSDEQMKRVPEQAPLGEMLNALADGYDYGVEERKGSVFVLKKRYSDPRDLPGVTREECRAALKDMLRALAPYNPHTSTNSKRDPLLGEFMTTLTDEQIRRLGGVHTGTSIPDPLPKSQALPVASLSARQRTLVWRFITYYYVQARVQGMEAAIRKMDQLVPEESVTFRWTERGGQRAFGYQIPVTDPKAPPGLVFFRALPDAPSDSVPLFGFGKDTPPQEARDKREMAPSTLASVVASLNARRKDTEPKITVDDALAPKPVIVFGSEAASPRQILDALAAVYGLRVVTDEDGALRLSRPSFRLAATIADLPEAVRRTFPEPLLRAFHTDESERLRREVMGEDLRRYQRRVAEEAGEIQTPEEAKAERERSQKRSEQFSKVNFLPDAIQIAATQHLRALTEPKVEADPNGRLPLSALNQEVKNTLAYLIMAEEYRGLNILFHRPAPDWITHLDQMYLVGGVYEHDGKKTFALFTAKSSPDGENVDHVGGGRAGVEYIR